MPMVNPDGSNLFGRLNANTVNINRNYPVDWGETDEDPVLNNPGPHPESELETQLNIEWFNRTQPDYYASVHCCGNLWLFPYGVEGWDAADKDMMMRVCEEGLPDVGDACGPIWSTIYPASGSSVDTVYEYTGSVAFGYEMSGRGAVSLWGQPFTAESVRIQERESWEGVLHAFENVHRYGAHLTFDTFGVSRGELIVGYENTGYGNLSEGRVTFTNLETEEVFEAEFPATPAGARGELRVAVGDEYALWEETKTYKKRIEGETWTAPRTTYLLIEPAGMSGWSIKTASTLEGIEAMDTVGLDHTESTPTVGLVPVLALVGAGLLGLMRRRR